MEVQTRHTPAFGVARVLLGPGEAVQAAAESMLASSFGLTEVTGSRSGLRGRAALGPSVFTAGAAGGWIDLAPTGPGDVYPLVFDGSTGWNLHRGAVLARPPSVRLDSGWAALQTLFGGDNGFLEHYSGSGKLVLTCPGPVEAFTLEAGEIVTIRPGFLLGYPDSVQARLRATDPSGPQSVRTGEGLALDVAGPGSVLVQVRSR